MATLAPNRILTPQGWRQVGRGSAGEPTDPDPDPPPDPAPTTMQSSVTQHGITLEFAEARPVGQYVNGDYFVVGDVTLVSKSPAWSGTHHGAMVDPPIGSTGYDTGQPGYDAALNIAATLPTTVVASSAPRSIVATETFAGAGSPPNRTAEALVLTVEPTAPSVSSFRPPYVAGPKPHHSLTAVDWGLLPSLPPPPNVTGTAERSFAFYLDGLPVAWVNHNPGWNGNRTIPHKNGIPQTIDYGANLGTLYASALLKLAISGHAQSDRENLGIHCIQQGIDHFALYQAGASWPGNGGHSSGRKLPILWAGKMLGDAAMRSIAANGDNHLRFDEDGSSYFDDGRDPSLPSAFHGRGAWSQDWPAGGTTWANANGYHFAGTTDVWLSVVMAAWVYDLVADWAWPALFDYLDAHVAWRDGGAAGTARDAWSANMWIEYRSDYGTVEVPGGS